MERPVQKIPRGYILVSPENLTAAFPFRVAFLSSTFVSVKRETSVFQWLDHHKGRLWLAGDFRWLAWRNVSTKGCVWITSWRFSNLHLSWSHFFDFNKENVSPSLRGIQGILSVALFLVNESVKFKRQEVIWQATTRAHAKIVTDKWHPKLI